MVAIQFPLLKSATDFLDTDQSYWPYAGLWRELRSEATAKRFSELGVQFFDMSRDPLNADPGNFFDPAHPTERGVLRTIIDLLDRKDFRDLFPNIDKAALEDGSSEELAERRIIRPLPLKVRRISLIVGHPAFQQKPA